MSIEPTRTPLNYRGIPPATLAAIIKDELRSWDIDRRILFSDRLEIATDEREVMPPFGLAVATALLDAVTAAQYGHDMTFRKFESTRFGDRAGSVAELVRRAIHLAEADGEPSAS
jgi:hypothetical protein